LYQLVDITTDHETDNSMRAQFYKNQLLIRRKKIAYAIEMESILIDENETEVELKQFFTLCINSGLLLSLFDVNIVRLLTIGIE
jgi:hypothetical protein